MNHHDTEGMTHRLDEYDGPNDGGCWDTYEEAQLRVLKKLIVKKRRWQVNQGFNPKNN
jgi:hypothetical protein